MRLSRTIRSGTIAGALASLSVWAGVGGAILAVLAGAVALPLVPKPSTTGCPQDGTGVSLSEYWPWLGCTGAFAAFVIAFVPVTQVQALTVALVLLSPVFGTSVYLIDAAVGRILESAATQK